MPVYWLYSLVFVDDGITPTQLSALLGLWSMTAVVAEVPTGALADRWSRRRAVAAGGALEAAGFLAWIVSPNPAGYAVGFVLWGIGGSFASGALEALLYDGLHELRSDAEGATRDHADDAFATILSRVRAAELWVQPPAAVIASVLFAAGGHLLVLWVSVGWSLVTAGVALWLPERRRVQVTHSSEGPGGGPSGGPDGFDGNLTGTSSDTSRRCAPGWPRPRRSPVRGAVVVVAAVAGLDAIDEYFPLMARDWGLSTGVTPVTLAVISLAGAVGAATAGRTVDLSNRSLGRVLVAAAVLLGVLGAARFPVGLAAVSVGYGLYRMVAVAFEIRLQDRITGPSRATVSSVAALGTELSGLLLLGRMGSGRDDRCHGAHDGRRHPGHRGHGSVRGRGSRLRRSARLIVVEVSRWWAMEPGTLRVGVFACFVAGVVMVGACGATDEAERETGAIRTVPTTTASRRHGHDTTPTHRVGRARVRVAHRRDRPGGPGPHGRPVDASRLPGRIRWGWSCSPCPTSASTVPTTPVRWSSTARLPTTWSRSSGPSTTNGSRSAA